MKTKLIFGSIVGIAVGWLAYALITLCCLNCCNVLLYLIPHVVFGVLFVSFLCLYCKTMKSLCEHENKMKESDLDRKIRWEKEQLEICKKKKEFEADMKKSEKPFDTEKLPFDQLLALAKQFKENEKDLIKKEMDKLREDIELLKLKKDLTVEITQTMLNKSQENNTPNTVATNE